MLYTIEKDKYPVGVEYRSLSTHTILKGKEVIETKEPVIGLTEAVGDEVTHLGDISQCIATFETRKKLDPTPDVEQAVNRLVELSVLYPKIVAEKMKSVVSRENMELSLSQDGKPISINAPEGWVK